jgi:hypothetical protein
MVVQSVTPDTTTETLRLRAVPRSEPYGEDGLDENNTFARFTPMAELHMVIANPALQGKFSVGQEFYVDFTDAAAPENVIPLQATPPAPTPTPAPEPKKRNPSINAR